MDKKSIEILVEKIPRRGMSVDCQKFLPNAVDKYFREESLEELTTRKKGFAKGIYYILEERVKMNSLKKATSIMSLHPKDVKEDAEFADTIITYCTYYPKLKKDIFKLFDRVFKKDKESKELIYKRYKNGNKCDVRRELKILGRNPEMYNFIIDKVLNKII